MTTKLFLSVAVRLLLLLRMTQSFFPVNNNNILSLQKQGFASNNNNRPLFEPLFVTSSTPSSSSTRLDDDISTKQPLLKTLYPKLLAYKERYGTPNIPIETGEDGRQCQQLRRLHVQQKLQPSEVELLENLGFIFQLSLEDLYWDADFDIMFRRLQQQQQPNSDEDDPELEAWVAGLRLLGPDKVRPEHALQLVYVGFQWKTKNKPCNFMKKFRETKENVDLYGKAFLLQPEIQDWISKQRLNRSKYKMSDAKYQHMVELVGEDWMNNNDNNNKIYA